MDDSQNFLISVVVPVYNVELYLERCILSLVNQSLEELEVIVVNDGSTDGCQDIIDHFAIQYPSRVRSFIKDNGGLSDARNFGITHAKGKYIGFVDGDDYVSEDMFRDMVHLAEKHNAQMVVCNLQKVDAEGNIVQKLEQIPHLPEKIILKDNFSVFSDLGYFACNKVFKKELFTGKKFKKNIHFEDIQLVPQLLLQCTILAHTQAFHYQYLERVGSISKTHNHKGLDILSAIEDVESCFYSSHFSSKTDELKGFQILQGVYSFLAYLAFVKDETLFNKMSKDLDEFLRKRNIKKKDILQYSRFGKNYILSLPLAKKIFYLLYFSGLKNILRKLI